MKLRAALFGIAGALLLILGASSALAANKTFTWTPPTQYEDGTPLPASQIAGYRLVCTGAAAVDVLVPVTQPLIRDFAPGSYTCVLHTRAPLAPNTVESVASNSVSFTVPQPRPNAATGFSVN